MTSHIFQLEKDSDYRDSTVVQYNKIPPFPRYEILSFCAIFYHKSCIIPDLRIFIHKYYLVGFYSRAVTLRVFYSDRLIFGGLCVDIEYQNLKTSSMILVWHKQISLYQPLFFSIWKSIKTTLITIITVDPIWHWCFCDICLGHIGRRAYIWGKAYNWDDVYTRNLSRFGRYHSLRDLHLELYRHCEK